MNDYVHRIHEFPGVIFGGDDGTIVGAELERLRCRLRAYPSIVCEIGSGSGGHLIELARRHPTTLCVGFELRFKRIVRTAEKAARLGIQNILLLHVNALRIAEFFADGSISGVYINFPDPWWDKRRWSKHRLLSPGYLAIIKRLLSSDGVCSFKSDHAQYFDMVVESATPYFRVERLSRNLHASEYAQSAIHSEFEKLFQFKQLPVHWVELRPIA